jgi:signal transduction histidine kinase
MIVHAAQDPRARACALLQAAGVVSFLGVPLVARDRPIGVLSVMTDSRREFAPEEVALLTGLAAQGASAIENAQLFADVQERMEHQQRALARLVQSAHLASVGVMAGGIAHDINNPLCIISNHLQLLRLRREGISPEVEAALTSIETSVQRIAGSIEALLEYARVRPDERQRTDLNEAIRRILLLLQYHPMCRRVRVVTDLMADLPAVQLDRAAWEQVLLELLTNAREAMADDGTVRIRTRCRGAGTNGHATEGVTAEASGVEVVVEDDGPGITSEEIARAFDPFFTTKAAKRGVGIGLKICRDIVHKHGGDLRLERGDPVGTRVVIELPALTDAPPSESPDRARADWASGGNDTKTER